MERLERYKFFRVGLKLLMVAFFKGYIVIVQ